VLRANSRSAVPTAAGVVLGLGHQRRRQPASRALKRLIDEGALGRVAQIEGNVSADYGFASTITPEMWRADRAETPGVMVLEKP